MAFNETHSVSRVMKDINLSEELRTLTPNEIDLRFFSQVHFGDTYNGGPNPIIGFRYLVTFYGNQPVHAFFKRYDESGGFGSGTQGSELFSRMYGVARAFLEIQGIAQRKYRKEPSPSETESGGEEKTDQVWIKDEELEILLAHPQYQDIEAVMGIRLTRIEKSGKVFVDVTKHRERE